VCVHTKFPRAQVLVRTYTGHSPHLDMEFPLHSSWPSPRQCDAVNLCLLHTCCQIGVSLQHTYGNFSFPVFLSHTEQNRAEQKRTGQKHLSCNLISHFNARNRSWVWSCTSLDKSATLCVFALGELRGQDLGNL